MYRIIQRAEIFQKYGSSIIHISAIPNLDISKSTFLGDCYDKQVTFQDGSTKIISIQEIDHPRIPTAGKHLTHSEGVFEPVEVDIKHYIYCTGFISTSEGIMAK